eukprot:3443064-Pyramimonas_sp.AAC.1
MVNAGSEHPAHNGYNRERSPFPMPLLHYEVYQLLPSRAILSALLKHRPNSSLKDACGLSALQVSVCLQGTFRAGFRDMLGRADVRRAVANPKLGFGGC